MYQKEHKAHDPADSILLVFSNCSEEETAEVLVVHRLGRSRGLKTANTSFFSLLLLVPSSSGEDSGRD